MQVDVQKRIKETEKKLNEIPHVARQHKVSNSSYHWCRNLCSCSSVLKFAPSFHHFLDPCLSLCTLPGLGTGSAA